MNKRVFCSLMLCIVFGSTGCAENYQYQIQPETSTDKYATQTPMTQAEFSIYLSKQASIFANFLESRLIYLKNPVDSKTELINAKLELRDMEKAKEELKTIHPPYEREEDQAAMLTTMNTIHTHMKNYIKRLEEGKSVNKYSDLFFSDFNQLTGLSNTYYQ